MLLISYQWTFKNKIFKMDKISQTKCAYIYDEVITGPLGTEVIKYFINDFENDNQDSDQESDQKQEDNGSLYILQIRDKLDENKYSSPQSFLEEVESTFLLKARDYESDSDISLSLLTLLQLIKEKFEKCFPSKQDKPLINEFNSFLNGFDEFGQNIPNDRKSFIKFYNSASQLDDTPKRPIRPSKIKIADQKTDVEELYKRVMDLKTDKDFERIVDIIVSHEPSYSHSENVVEIDLYKCQPYTLKLIKNYVDSQEKEEGNQENGSNNENDDE